MFLNLVADMEKFIERRLSSQYTTTRKSSATFKRIRSILYLLRKNRNIYCINGESGGCPLQCYCETVF